MVTRKTITVTDQQDAWIKSRIAEGDFTNDSELMRDLIRKEQERTHKIAQLQKLITEGLESGPSARTMDDIVTSVETRLGVNGWLSSHPQSR